MNFLIVFFLLLIVQISFGNQDFYSILNVKSSASQMQIKKAFRKLAKQLHPDKNKNDPNASKKFQELSAAYEILSDTEKRKLYDKCGEQCLKKERMMDNSDPFSYILRDFGFNFGNNDNNRKGFRKGSNIYMKMQVTLDEIYSGNFEEIVHNKVVLKSAPGIRKCNCHEEMVTRSLGPGRYQMITQTVCEECPNYSLENEEKLLDIEIEPGVLNGHQIHFPCEGEPDIDGEPGDLYIILEEIPHKIYERRGNDLLTNITISLQDALTGIELELKHLDGHKIFIKSNDIISPISHMKIIKEGMPNYNNNYYGDMYITFDINFPKINFNDDDREKIRKILNQTAVNKVYNGLNLNEIE